MHSRNYIEPPLTRFNANSQRVSFHYLPSNRKYRLRNRVAPRFHSTRGLSLDGTHRDEKFRHWCRVARLDIDAPGRVATTVYARFIRNIFAVPVFFIPFSHAMWKAREKKRSAAIVKSITLPPTAFRVAIEKHRSLKRAFIKCGAWIIPRIIREAEHRLNEEME